MTKPQDPKKKKALDNKKQFVSDAEYPHGFRRNWPRKKSRSNRKYRHHIAQLLSNMQNQVADENTEILEAGTLPVRRDIVRKWGTTSRGKEIDRHLAYRVNHAGYNIFKSDYPGEHKRQRFVHFLTALTTGKRGYSRDLARRFNNYLEPLASSNPEHIDIEYQSNTRIKQWLKSFFQDEPQWELRLREWIVTTLEADKTER